MRRPFLPLLALLVVAYPALVYFSLLSQRAMLFAGGVLALVLLIGLSSLRKGAGRRTWRALRPLFPVGAVATLVLVSGDERFLLALPVLASLGLLAIFAHSLGPGRISQVGLIARAERGMDTLPPYAESYCRKVTGLWCAFLLANASVAAALAIVGPLAWWAAYTGLIAYLCAGALMLGERAYRAVWVEPVVRRELAAMSAGPMAMNERRE